MADRFPLILNTNANQIQEIASGDTLDLSGTNIKGVGIITATNLSGNIIAGAGTSDIVAGIATVTDLRVGGDTSFSEDLVVTGNARVTGILTVGTSSIILNDSANTIKVGTALTLGHTQGLQFHTQNLHSAGFEVNQINASGIITATGVDINGDLDVDSHTNLDNVSVAGVSTFTGNADFSSGIDVTGVVNSTVAGGNNQLKVETTSSGDASLSLNASGSGGHTIEYIRSTNVLNFKQGGGSVRMSIAADGTVDVARNLNANLGLDVTGNATVSGDIDVDGHTNLDNVNVAGVSTFAGAVNTQALTATSGTFSGNVSIGGTLTYEDVTNIDSVGIITARNGVDVTGTITADGARFTDDGSASPTVSIFTDDASPYALNIGNSSYNASSPFGLNFFNNNSGEGYFRHIGNGAYKDYHFSLHDNCLLYTSPSPRD